MTLGMYKRNNERHAMFLHLVHIHKFIFEAKNKFICVDVLLLNNYCTAQIETEPFLHLQDSLYHIVTMSKSWCPHSEQTVTKMIVTVLEDGSVSLTLWEQLG